MIEAPHVMLEKLLAAKPETDHEMTYAISEPLGKGSEVRQLASIEAQYTLKYLDLKRELTTALGSPSFDDSEPNDQAPTWYPALRFSYRRQKVHFVYAALRHDSTELPFIVVYGITGTNSDLLSESSTVHLSDND